MYYMSKKVTPLSVILCLLEKHPQKFINLFNILDFSEFGLLYLDARINCGKFLNSIKILIY